MNLTMKILNDGIFFATTAGRKYTFGERMYIGILGTISGMLIVFLALILISSIVNLFKHFEKRPMSKVEEKEQEQIIDEVVEEVVQTYQDDLEVVAAITAAIAVSLNTTSDKLRVRSLKRVSGINSAWNASGRHENLQNNLY